MNERTGVSVMKFILRLAIAYIVERLIVKPGTRYGRIFPNAITGGKIYGSSITNTYIKEQSL